MSIEVSSNDWNALSEADRTAIKKIISDNFPGQTVDPSDAGDAVITTNVCETACNTAEAIAIEACSGLGFPGNLVCVTVAREAGKACRRAC